MDRLPARLVGLDALARRLRQDVAHAALLAVALIVYVVALVFVIGGNPDSTIIGTPAEGARQPDATFPGAFLLYGGVLALAAYWSVAGRWLASLATAGAAAVLPLATFFFGLMAIAPSMILLAAVLWPIGRRGRQKTAE